jgi:ATP-dependent DNA ligase
VPVLIDEGGWHEHRISAGRAAAHESRARRYAPARRSWQFEPKWDGFRAIASRFGETVEIMSKSGKSLPRYFPEIVAALAATKQTNYVIDGELILPLDDILSFDGLQARLHPAESRIRKLSQETPAIDAVRPSCAG